MHPTPTPPRRRPPGATASELSDAIARASADESQAARSQLLKDLYALAEMDPKAALDAIAKLPTSHSAWYLEDLQQKLVNRDPKACAEWLSAMKPKSNAEIRLGAGLFGFLAAKDPELAFSAMANHSKEERASLIGNGTNMWAQVADPALVIGEIRNRLQGGEREYALGAAVTAMAFKDPQAAFKTAGTLEPDTRYRALLNVFAIWTNKDGHAAVVEALKECSPAVVQGVLERNQFVEKLATKDPDAAVGLLSNIVFTNDNAALFQRAAKELGKQSPSMALDWLKSFPETDSSGSLVGSVFQGWTETSRADALAAALKTTGSNRQYALNGIAKSLGASSFDIGFQTLDSIDASEKEGFFASMATGAGSLGPQMAIKLLTDPRVPADLQASETSERILNQSMGSLATSQPQKAVEAFEALTDRQRWIAVSGLVSGWGKNDPKAAAEWVMALPDSSIRDRGIETIANVVDSTDPDSAAKWRKLLTK